MSTTTKGFSPKINEMLKAIPWGEMRVHPLTGHIRHPEKDCPLAVWTGDKDFYLSAAANRGMSQIELNMVMNAADYRDGRSSIGAKLRKAMRDRISKARRRG